MTKWRGVNRVGQKVGRYVAPDHIAAIAHERASQCIGACTQVTSRRGGVGDAVVLWVIELIGVGRVDIMKFNPRCSCQSCLKGRVVCNGD